MIEEDSLVAEETVLIRSLSFCEKACFPLRKQAFFIDAVTTVTLEVLDVEVL